MFQQKYYKYKRKYLNLKKNIYENTFLIDDPSIERDDEYFSLDRPTNTIHYNYPFYIEEDEKGTVSIEDITLPTIKDKIIDIGRYGLARGKNVEKYNFEDENFIEFNLTKIDKNKIVIINTLDDFDDFTEKYGAVTDYFDLDPVYGKQNYLYIKWNIVMQDYKGVTINNGLHNDRYQEAFYKGKTYVSWWIREYKFDDVLIFMNDKISKQKGKAIIKPFKGFLYKENDFPEDNYTSINIELPERNILKLETYQEFDKFTNKYGAIYKGNKIRIDWDSVKNNYQGLYIDKDSDIYDVRKNKAFFNDKKYISWIKNDNIKQGIVYIFRD